VQTVDRLVWSVEAVAEDDAARVVVLDVLVIVVVVLFAIETGKSAGAAEPVDGLLVLTQDVGGDAWGHGRGRLGEERRGESVVVGRGEIVVSHCGRRRREADQRMTGRDV
jgi:hypothetical protein